MSRDSDRRGPGREGWDLAAAEARIAELEEQLQAARRGAGLGPQVARVAHELNNVMTAILGHVEVALGASRSEEVIEDLRYIREITRSSAATLDQLVDLISGRQGASGAQVDAVIGALEPMIRRALGGSCQVSCSLGAGRARLGISQGQLEQLVLNLVLGTRDRGPDGGALAIETGLVTGEAGPRVALIVSRSGGLSEQAPGVQAARAIAERAGGSLSCESGVLIARLPLAAPISPGAGG